MADAVKPQTAEQLERLQTQLESQQRDHDQKLQALGAERDSLDDELKRLRAEVAQAKAANAVRHDTHDYSEALTRSALIDEMLFEASWPLDRVPDLRLLPEPRILRAGPADE